LDNFIATFSIVAFDPSNEDVGVAVQSKAFAVGLAVPWVEAEVGAIATQAQTNVAYGPEGLHLLRSGLSAEEVLTQLTKRDELRKQRQVGIVDTKGNVASFTGQNCMEWAGSQMGTNFTAQGNILVSEDVVLTMGDYFERTEGDLAEKLIAALEGGQAAGGDSRGRQSAALIVARKDAGLRGYGDRFIDIRIDDHQEPIVELRRLLHLTRIYQQTRECWAAIYNKDFEKSLTHAKQAVDLSPTIDEAHLVLGFAFYFLGNENEAEREFQQVLQINPMLKGQLKQYFREYSIDDSFSQRIFSK